MNVKLISITPDAESIVMFCARVSNPKNQTSTNTGLLKYCIRNRHWSPFEMANMLVEIKTSRAIAAQVLRHRSFSFQEFSQRYSEATEFETYEARRQDEKNRQNSIDDMSDEDKKWFQESQQYVQVVARIRYEEALERGIAKEQARFLLPLSTTTTLYMNGTLRSWIHYVNLRTEEGVQREHQEIAQAIKHVMKEHLETISGALEW